MGVFLLRQTGLFPLLSTGKAQAAYAAGSHMASVDSFNVWSSAVRLGQMTLCCEDFKSRLAVGNGRSPRFLMSNVANAECRSVWKGIERLTTTQGHVPAKCTMLLQDLWAPVKPGVICSSETIVQV